MRRYLLRWPATTWRLGGLVILSAGVLIAWSLSGCQKSAEQVAQELEHGEEAGEQEASSDLEETPEPEPAQTMTLAQFIERFNATAIRESQMELLGRGYDVVKDKKGLARFVIEIMHGDEDEEVRANAAETLGEELGRHLQRETVRALVRAADPEYEPEVEVRQAAVRSLMDYRTPRARAALRRAIRDPVPTVAHLAAQSLVRSFGREGPRGWARLIDMLGRPEGDASALASLELRARGRGPVAMLIDQLRRSKRARQRAAIATCLGVMCSGNTPRQQRFAKATRATSRTARQESTPDPRPIEVLIEALSDSDALVREAAAQALGLIGDPRAADPLARRLKDPDEYVRKRAASALMLLPSADALVALNEAAVNDPAPDVRRYAVEALGWLAHPVSVRTLIKALDDESAEVRTSAARYLGRLGNKKAVDALIVRFFKDEDADVRWAAVRSVGQLGGKAAEPALTRLLTSGAEEPQVLQAAREALRRMGGAVPLSEEARRLFDQEGSG